MTPDKVHSAEGRKSELYVKDGLFVGGDKAVDEVLVRDIRRATNAGYERIVIDLEANIGGEAAPIPRPPYYQVAVTQSDQRVTVTFWGNPKLGFVSQQVLKAFHKSAIVRRVELLPRVDADSWTFSLILKPGASVEVFDLGSPVRVILDVRAGRQPKA